MKISNETKQILTRDIINAITIDAKSIKKLPSLKIQINQNLQNSQNDNSLTTLVNAIADNNTIYNTADVKTLSLIRSKMET